jgi:hypothetical protein
LPRTWHTLPFIPPLPMVVMRIFLHGCLPEACSKICPFQGAYGPLLSPLPPSLSLATFLLFSLLLSSLPTLLFPWSTHSLSTDCPSFSWLPPLPLTVVPQLALLSWDALLNPVQSPSHITTGGQSVSPSWCRAPIILGLMTVFYCPSFDFCSLCRRRAPSLTRGRVCRLFLSCLVFVVFTIFFYTYNMHRKVFTNIHYIQGDVGPGF